MQVEEVSVCLELRCKPHRVLALGLAEEVVGGGQQQRRDLVALDVVPVLWGGNVWGKGGQEGWARGVGKRGGRVGGRRRTGSIPGHGPLFIGVSRSRPSIYRGIPVTALCSGRNGTG